MITIEQHIRSIANFPKPGITYKDITPLLADPQTLSACVEAFIKPIKHLEIDKVVGVESRGFFLGTLLAQRLNAGFVPVRKVGKLPFTTVKANYSLEYGTDSLEMHTDAISPGERVLLHDDVLATGGTASAAAQLIEQLGGVIVHCNFIIELGFLNGRNQLKNYTTNSLITY